MRCYIIDLDGTIYRGSNPLPYAADFISRLNDEGIKYVFFTNSPEQNPQAIENLLHSLSIPAQRKRVITSGTLAIEYLVKKTSPKKPVRVNILGSRYLKTQATLCGLMVTQDQPDYVLASFSNDIVMREITKACQQIRMGAKFIATNPDDVIPSDEGLVPHTGAIIYAITCATGVTPFIIGKPSVYLMEYFTAFFGCSADDICVVGDRLDTDMLFAKNCGFQAYLVLTGITSSDHAFACHNDFDRCFENLKELASYNAAESECTV